LSLLYFGTADAVLFQVVVEFEVRVAFSEKQVPVRILPSRQSLRACSGLLEGFALRSLGSARHDNWGYWFSTAKQAAEKGEEMQIPRRARRASAVTDGSE
jgi:hypothetical protein